MHAYQPHAGQGFSAAADVAAEGALNSNEFRAFKLLKKEKLTHNTSLYRFELPNNQVRLICHSAHSHGCVKCIVSCGVNT